MNKTELIKNKLDLEYKFESQKALIFLTFGTITLISFLASLLLQKQYSVAGVCGFIIIVISLIFYNITKKKLRNILSQIDELIN
ncbi:MAG: hypothetical protein ACOC1K_02420 [Nanoarchaeota archaeon]